MKPRGLTKPDLPLTWTASVATRHENPKFRRQARGAVSVTRRNGSPKFARLGQFFAVPRNGNHEFHKLGRLRSCRDMETQVPLTRGAVFVGAGDGNRKAHRTRRFPSCHETEAPKFRRLGRFSVVPRHGNSSSPHRGHGFCRGGTWKSPSSPELGGFLRPAKNGNPRAPRTRAAVSVAPWHGNSKFRMLGRRFPSRHDMETRSSACLGGGFRHAAQWNPQVPRVGVAVSIAAGHGDPRFPRLGEIFRRATKWKPQVSPNWVGCPSRGEMETPEFHRLGRRACTRRDMEKTRSSPDSGGSFQRRGNPEFPRAGDSVKSPSFQRAVKHGNPRFPSGAGHGNPKFPGLGRGPPPCAAKWNPGLARDAAWKPQFPQRVSLGGAGGHGNPKFRRPGMVLRRAAKWKHTRRVPRTWAAELFAIPRHGNLGFPCHRPQVSQTGDRSLSRPWHGNPKFPLPVQEMHF